MLITEHIIQIRAIVTIQYSNDLLMIILSNNGSKIVPQRAETLVLSNQEIS